MSAYTPSTPDERAIELALRNTIRINAFRLKAGLPLRADRAQVAAWHARLNTNFHLGAFRRNHPRAS